MYENKKDCQLLLPGRRTYPQLGAICRGKLQALLPRTSRKNYAAMKAYVAALK